MKKKLFELLLKNKGNIVLSEVIENTIWPDYPIKDSTRRTLVYRLRKKLNDNIIEHVPRIGCRLLVQ
jgi:DNA-binding response OmpR family regulator